MKLFPDHLVSEGLEESLVINNIYNMDCTEGMRMIPDNSIDLVIADPPYGINYYSNWSKDSNYRSRVKSVDGISNDKENNTDFLSEVVQELDRVLKPNTHIYWFTRWDRVMIQQPVLEDYFKLKNSIIWMKNNWSMGDLQGAYAGQYENILFAQKGRRTFNEVDGKKRHPDILQFNRVPPNKLNHSHEKPLDLISFLIEKSSNRGETILDPFVGSGTTAVAALHTNRNYIGFELDPECAVTANERIAEAKAELYDDK